MGTPVDGNATPDDGGLTCEDRLSIFRCELEKLTLNNSLIGGTNHSSGPHVIVESELGSVVECACNQHPMLDQSNRSKLDGVPVFQGDMLLPRQRVVEFGRRGVQERHRSCDFADSVSDV